MKSEPETHANDYTQLARVADRLLTPVVVISPDSTLRYANVVAAELFGIEPSELVDRKILSLVHPTDRPEVSEKLSSIVDGTRVGGFAQFRFRGRQSQPWRVFDCYAHNLIDDPDVRGILVSGEDVTEQERISQALRTLSQCNRDLIHATDEATLVENLCRSIVDSGKYMLAWVGYVTHDAAQSVSLVTAHGVTEYLDGVHVSWADDEFGQGPTGTAIRTNAVQTVKDLRRSKRCAPWKSRINRFGVRSACAMPLNLDGETIGALTIYSREPGTFGEAELELLNELANNLAYGVGRLRDAERLTRNETHLREAERLAHVGHWEWNVRTGALEFMADEMYDIFAVVPDEWPGTYESFLSFVVPGDRAAFQQASTRRSTRVRPNWCTASSTSAASTGSFE